MCCERTFFLYCQELYGQALQGNALEDGVVFQTGRWQVTEISFLEFFVGVLTKKNSEKRGEIKKTQPHAMRGQAIAIMSRIFFGFIGFLEFFRFWPKKQTMSREAKKYSGQGFWNMFLFFGFLRLFLIFSKLF